MFSHFKQLKFYSTNIKEDDKNDYCFETSYF